MPTFQPRLRASLRSIAPLGVLLVCGCQAVGDHPTPRVDSGTDDAGTDGALVTVAQGQLLGLITDAGTVVWQGVPFAWPPVGDLRWKPPEYPPASWPGVRSAQASEGECVQPNPDGGVPVGDEDCLYLNVQVPLLRGASPLPVIVFIHGGAFTVGDASLPGYNGPQLALAGPSVIVTINYRLGALGFLALPELATEDPNHVDGTYGILDQQAALRWVHDNIAAFGGDPAHVLIWGQSAGSASVLLQVVSPLAAGLFTAAFAESGVDGYRGGTTLAGAERTGEQYAQKLGCADAGSVLACLRALPPMTVDGGSYAALPGTFGPVVDGYVLPDHILNVLQNGLQNATPMLIGSTAAEAANPNGVQLTPPLLSIDGGADYLAAIAQSFAQTAELVLDQYPLPLDAGAVSAQAQYAQVWTDFQFTCPTRQVVRALSATQTQSVSRYFWTHTDSSGLRRALGPAHATDLPYWFDNFGFAPDFSEVTMAQNMSGAIGLLAATGNPNSAVVQWPLYQTPTDEYLQLDDVFQVDAGVRNALCDFWDQVNEGVLATYPDGGSAPRIDEIGYYQQLAAQRPDLLADAGACVDALWLNTQYRTTLLSGTQTAAQLEDSLYTDAGEAVDLAWIASQQQTEIDLCDANAAGGCHSICDATNSVNCAACAGAGFDAGSSTLPPYYPSGYGLCGFVGYKEGPSTAEVVGGIDYKVFFQLNNPSATLTPALVTEFAARLAADGFQGDFKINSDPHLPSQERFHYNDIIVHASTPAFARIAEQDGLGFFGALVTGYGRGLDVGPPNAGTTNLMDWHAYLCAYGTGLAGLPAEAHQWVLFQN